MAKYEQIVQCFYHCSIPGPTPSIDLHIDTLGSNLNSVLFLTSCNVVDNKLMCEVDVLDRFFCNYRCTDDVNTSVLHLERFDFLALTHFINTIVQQCGPSESVGLCRTIL